MSSTLVRALKELPADPQHRIEVALAYKRSSQSELARAVAIDPTKLSKALNGFRALTDLEEQAIADFLDVPRAVLFSKVAA